MTPGMTLDELLQALALPDSTRVQQRVPKKLLVEHGAATPQDKRLIQDGVDEITWLASLKPHLTGVPEHEDEHRHYREAAVLGLTLRPGTRPARIGGTAAPRRAAPGAAGHHGGWQTLGLSLAHLRWSQTEAGQTVLDGPVMSVVVPPGGGGAAFRVALALANQPRIGPPCPCSGVDGHHRRPGRSAGDRVLRAQHQPGAGRSGMLRCNNSVPFGASRRAARPGGEGAPAGPPRSR
jgi:hypothetical protein